MATNDVSPGREAALKALTWEDLFEATTALSLQIETLTKYVRDNVNATYYQQRLEAAQRAHDRLVVARVAP
ncbi:MULTISPECIES: hypothetical protein [unclassified Duganella]|jgi:hypothetical protein|uniref:hypothetical protein n=1 Tax=unclassified Duganella TaxID=2636909 RepID=UPI00088D2533|nr:MULTISPECIES: hypothetical protein [unclassified Duganella]SDH41588.1 hypothetical protein SAMN05216320_11323 [Duganella sp. OV458]SDK60766.1 hypothetical protein SAMN05428973_113140 [Duganella sp. OV510]